MNHPAVEQAIQRVVARAGAAGMPLGLFVADGKAAGAAAARGFRFLAMSTDAIYLWTAARAALSEARK
jgi:2-keto-3-deoxy-L-rhamnonate aldolase RhmA